jgi:hypothetical protein
MTTRRYEVLLPARFNDGHEVVEKCMRCLPDTVMQVVDRFGALTFDPRTTIGVWTAMGMRYDDELFRLAVDVPDTEDSRYWIATFKKELLKRFDQLEIYIVPTPSTCSERRHRAV